VNILILRHAIACPPSLRESVYILDICKGHWSSNQN